MKEYSNSQIRDVISEWIHSERDRIILSDRMIDGMTFEQIAEKHDMSVRQIKNIVYRLQAQLFRHL